MSGARGGAAAELLSALARSVEGRGPRIRALHLPPPDPAAPKEGEFCALELEDGAIGLSYVLLGDTRARLQAGGAGDLAGREALEVAGWYASREGLDRTLGYAAVNALSASLLARAGWPPPDAPDSLGVLAPGPGDHVGMVGLFRTLAERVVRAGARLTVLELKADLAGEREGYRVTLDPAELAPCNKVLSTSTILLNDTLDRVLGACKAARTLAIVGPGAGCLPDPLFARGVTLLGGTAVVDRPAFVRALTTGVPWGATARRTAISRATYPGLEELLRRAAQ